MLNEQDFNPDAVEIPGLDDTPYPDEPQDFDEAVGDAVEDDEPDDAQDADGAGDDGVDDDSEAPSDGDDDEGSGEESDDDADGDADDQVYFDDPELNAEVLRQAKRFGHLDPNNPEHLKTLKSFADAQLYIKKLKAEKGIEDTPDDGLTEFERALKAELDKAAPAKEDAPKPEEKKQDAPQRKGVDSDWQSVGDAYEALNRAWRGDDNGGKPDHFKIAEIENAMFARRAQDFLLPVVVDIADRIAEQRLQQQLGDVLPEIRQTHQQRQMAEDNHFAISELKKSEQFQDIEQMFEVIDGPPIVINGAEYPNTLLGQAIASAPEILEIRKTSPDGDPRKSHRLTTIAQLRLAYRRMNDLKAVSERQKETAKKAMQVGQNIERRNAALKRKQSVHKPADGNKSLDGGKGKKSYVEELNEAGPTSLEDLFG